MALQRTQNSTIWATRALLPLETHTLSTPVKTKCLRKLTPPLQDAPATNAHPMIWDYTGKLFIERYIIYILYIDIIL